MFVNTFWSLVPPIVAIGLALLTKETYSSLFIGIVVGALLATDFSPIGALDTIINDGLTAAIADNAGIFLFLVILGVMVALVNATGRVRPLGREPHSFQGRRAARDLRPRRADLHRRLLQLPHRRFRHDARDRQPEDLPREARLPH